MVRTWNPEGTTNNSKWPKTGVRSVTRNMQTWGCNRKKSIGTGLKQAICKHINLDTGSQQNMEIEGMRAVARVAT